MLSADFVLYGAKRSSLNRNILVNNDTERHILMSNFQIFFYFFHKETKLDMVVHIVVMMLVEGPHKHITFVYDHCY